MSDTDNIVKDYNVEVVVQKTSLFSAAPHVVPVMDCPSRPTLNSISPLIFLRALCLAFGLTYGAALVVFAIIALCAPTAQTVTLSSEGIHSATASNITILSYTASSAYKGAHCKWVVASMEEALRGYGTEPRADCVAAPPGVAQAAGVTVLFLLSSIVATVLLALQVVLWFCQQVRLRRALQQALAADSSDGLVVVRNNAEGRESINTPQTLRTRRRAQLLCTLTALVMLLSSIWARAKRVGATAEIQADTTAALAREHLRHLHAHYTDPSEYTMFFLLLFSSFVLAAQCLLSLPPCHEGPFPEVVVGVRWEALMAHQPAHVQQQQQQQDGLGRLSVCVRE